MLLPLVPGVVLPSLPLLWVTLLFFFRIVESKWNWISLNSLFQQNYKTYQALSPLAPRLWLHICQDVLQHELKQLGMIFHFALLFFRFSSRVHHLDALLFTPIHEFISDLYTMRINFEPARSHVWSYPGISQQSLQSLGCFCVIVSKGNHSVHRTSFTDHMQSFQPFSRYPTWQFFDVHGNAF